MRHIFEVLEIPFVGKVVFYFTEKLTEVTYPPHIYVQGRIFLPQWDEVHYLTLPSLDKARQYLTEIIP